MTVAYSTTLRNARNDAITTAAGASALLSIYNGTRPATGGTATTLLAQLTCNATFAPASSGGVLTLNSIAQNNAAATGTATWARLTTSGATFVSDLDVGVQVTTTITGSSGAATITVGANTGLIVGNYVSGTGIATGARIVNINGTTVTLSINNSGAVSGNGTFSYDINLISTSITSGQPVSVTSFTFTEGNA
jgi:hypothetical protein